MGIVMITYTLNWKTSPFLQEEEGDDVARNETNAVPDDNYNKWLVVKDRYMKHMRTMPLYRKSLPNRMAAFHYCYNNKAIKLLAELNFKISVKETRLRFRFHYGAHIECIYELMSFGIHPSMLLVDEAGNFRTYMAHNFIKRQRKKELQEQEQRNQQLLLLQQQRQRQQQQQLLLQQQQQPDLSFGVVLAASPTPTDIPYVPTPRATARVVSGAATTTTVAAAAAATTTTTASSVSRTNAPASSIAKTTSSTSAPSKKLVLVDEDDITDYDVLLGRGVPIQTHPGNLHLARLIEAHAESHKNAVTRFDKVALTWKILRMIKFEFGGRFLEKVHDDDDDAVAGVEGIEDTSRLWKTVEDSVARAKVSYGFRSYVKMQKERQKQKQNSKK